MADDSLVGLVKSLMYWGMEKFGKYYSSYRAFVYDRNDPDGLGRLQLYVPHVYGVQPYKIWAFPVGTPSGYNYGWHWIPQNGEMVFVEFEGGDPKKPLWKYGHFGKSPQGTPEIAPHLSDPDIYWFRTPKGLGIEFNDKTMEVKILGADIKQESTNALVKVGNTSIEITDSGINITAGDGNKVYVNGNHPVLFCKTAFASEIMDLKEIGVSETVRVG